MRGILHAIEFFTRVPLPAWLLRWRGFEERDLVASLAHWPLIGAGVGAVVCAVWWALLTVLPATSASGWLASGLSLFVGLMLTGALHEDGLADLVDGLGGSADRDRALAIMKDSRIGAYGACALILLFLVKCSLLVALGALSPVMAVLAWFAAQVLSRWMALCMAWALPYVSDVQQAKSRHVLAGVTWVTLGQAALWCVVLLAAFAPGWSMAYWLSGVAAMLLAWTYLHRLLLRRLQGVTGDALGATQQVCELAFLFGVLLACGRMAV